jgi:hypothetical protein
VLTAKIAGVTHCIIVAFPEALLKSGQGACFRLLASFPFGGQRCLQRGNVTSEVLGLDRHGPDCPMNPKALPLLN